MPIVCDEHADVNRFWNDIDHHGLSDEALYYQSLTFHIGQQEEKEPNNLKAVVEIEVSYRPHWRQKNVIAKDASNQHRHEPAHHERCFSPDHEPKKKSVN